MEKWSHASSSKPGTFPITYVLFPIFFPPRFSNCNLPLSAVNLHCGAMPTLTRLSKPVLSKTHKVSHVLLFLWELSCAKCVGSYGFPQHSLKPNSLNLRWHAEGPPTVCSPNRFAHGNGKCFLKIACFSQSGEQNHVWVFGFWGRAILAILYTVTPLLISSCSF